MRKWPVRQDEIAGMLSCEIKALPGVNDIEIAYDHAFGEGNRFHIQIRVYGNQTPLRPIFREIDRITRELYAEREDLIFYWTISPWRKIRMNPKGGV